MTRQTGVIVTNHAILRYLERAHGVDVAAARRRLAELAEAGIRAGALSVCADDVKLVLKDHKVVTVLPKWARLYEDRKAVSDD